ncbi:hypothetical protein BMF94_4799 [Rhodotorula taiwanensis]|uniref:Uncharacterized protein n=1 Tax=Rhodotorula taiwanensis TaxID=741276 RepID=A0A2S5B5V6_9BASI|nr:hypothetical protein BMF94_4799 [Rhodotorula taiwanensis]
MSTQAPAVGGASTSGGRASSTNKRQSPWDPYAVLPPSTKKRLDPKDVIKPKSYTQELSIPTGVAEERVAGKLLQLDLPEGKVSDRRKAQLAVREAEREKKRAKRTREGDCGLAGRRKRKALGGRAPEAIHYAAVQPVHELWLGYMAELLNLPVRSPSTSIAPSRAQPDLNRIAATSTLLSSYPQRPDASSAPEPREQQINVVNLQTKLIKAEFVGCRLAVKRAKNPSLVGLEGIVLQETQGTFKLVTPKSRVKVVPKLGTIFTLALPLDPPSGSTAPRELSFDLYGDSFAYRPADRVGKKWKAGTSAGGVDLM